MKAELENAQTEMGAGQSREVPINSNTKIEAQGDTEASKSAILDGLENKKKELVSYICPLCLYSILHYCISVLFHFYFF